MFSPVACPAVPYFSTLSHKSQDFKSKKNLNIRVFIFLQLLSEIFFILSRIQGGIIINVYMSSCKLPDFNKTSVFSRGSVYYSNIKLYDSPSSGSRVVPCGQTDRRTTRQAGRQTDRTDEANNRFSQFCEHA